MFESQKISAAVWRVLVIGALLSFAAFNFSTAPAQVRATRAGDEAAPAAQTASAARQNDSHQMAFARSSDLPAEGAAGEGRFSSWSWLLLGGLFLSAVSVSTAVFARAHGRRADDHSFFQNRSDKRPAYFVFEGGRAFNSNGVKTLSRKPNNTDQSNGGISVPRPSEAPSFPAKNQSSSPPNSTKADAPRETENNRTDVFARPKPDAAQTQALEPRAGSQTLDAPPRALETSISAFGIFRIEQEVSRLVEGEPHRLDVLTSRAPEDRRAIESVLMKWIRNGDADEDMRRRARAALEEYGFIARRCASLLCAADAFERASAARMLGEIRSPMALPFLIEALYDAENAVRVESVVSIGALGLPSAIGALLDAARRSPEIPPSVLQNALNACSVETSVIGELPDVPAAAQLMSGDERDEHFSNAEPAPASTLPPKVNRVIEGLRAKSPITPLPEWIEHETLYEALEQFQDPDVETRVTAAVLLAQFQTQRAVEALATMALRDPEPRVRAAAVTSLGALNHESVFASVVLALADEAREVRAAAARALSRLTFDRAEAYVRVLETFDDRELREVAHACAKVGLAAQALERLANPDPRQSYEARALLALMAKAGYVAPLIQTIENHADINVRLAVVNLLGMIGDAEIIEMLRRVVVRGDVPDAVRAAIMELIYNSDAASETTENSAARSDNLSSNGA
jgi:HEAT repeat protein